MEKHTYRVSIRYVIENNYPMHVPIYWTFDGISAIP